MYTIFLYTQVLGNQEKKNTETRLWLVFVLRSVTTTHSIYFATFSRVVSRPQAFYSAYLTSTTTTCVYSSQYRERGGCNDLFWQLCSRVGL